MDAHFAVYFQNPNPPSRACAQNGRIRPKMAGGERRCAGAPALLSVYQISFGSKADTERTRIVRMRKPRCAAGRKALLLCEYLVAGTRYRRDLPAPFCLV